MTTTVIDRQPDLVLYDEPTDFEIADAAFEVGTVDETDPIDIEEMPEGEKWPVPPDWWQPHVHEEAVKALLVPDQDDSVPMVGFQEVDGATMLRGASIGGFPVSSNPAYLGVASLRVPGTATYLPVRRDVGALLIGAAQEWHKYIEPLHFGWCWGYSFRAVTGGGSYSFHAAAIAVDLNAPLHPYGVTPYRNLNSRELATLAAIAHKYGLRSGAFYNGTKDAMHLEIIIGHTNALALVKRLQAAKVIGTRVPPYRPTIDASNMREAAAKDHNRPQGHGLHEYGTTIVEKALVREGLLDSRVAGDGYWGTTTRDAWVRWERRLGYDNPNREPGIPGLTALGKRQGFRVAA